MCLDCIEVLVVVALGITLAYAGLRLIVYALLYNRNTSESARMSASEARARGVQPEEETAKIEQAGNAEGARMYTHCTPPYNFSPPERVPLSDERLAALSEHLIGTPETTTPKGVSDCKEDCSSCGAEMYSDCKSPLKELW